MFASMLSTYLATLLQVGEHHNLVTFELPDASPKVANGDIDRALCGDVPIRALEAFDKVGVEVIARGLVARLLVQDDSRVIVGQQVAIAILGSILWVASQVPAVQLTLRYALVFILEHLGLEQRGHHPEKIAHGDHTRLVLKVRVRLLLERSIWMGERMLYTQTCCHNDAPHF